jgi:hypothetical protein
VSALRSRFAPAPGGGPWLGAHVPKGAARTTRLVINERHLWCWMAGYPSPVVHLVCRQAVDRGLRIAPLAIMGSAVRPGTRQGQAAPRASKLAP